MIIDCLGCHKPYDVSKYKPGQKLRCMCGQILMVPDDGWHPRPLITLHCSNCGGNLERGMPICPFCSALVDLSSARMTAYCPSCLSMSREGARFCSGCGKPLLSEIDRPEKVEERCPRCAVSMRNRQVESHKIIECPMCLGMFVSVNAFESLIRRQENRVGEISGQEGPRKSVLVQEVVTYIKCPECLGVMNRMNYGRISGVIVDYCKKHGYWLDNGELEKIADFAASGGLKEQYKLEMEEAKAAASKAKFEKAAAEAQALQKYDGESTSSAVCVAGLFKVISGLFD